MGTLPLERNSIRVDPVTHHQVPSNLSNKGVSIVLLGVGRSTVERDTAGRSHIAFCDGRIERRGERPIIPKDRVRYLSEISDTIRTYNRSVEEQGVLAIEAQALAVVARRNDDDAMAEAGRDVLASLDPRAAAILTDWDDTAASYAADATTYEIRGNEIEVETSATTLSGTRIPKVVFPGLTGWGDRVRWGLQENLPGRFPFAAGVFPFKRDAEDPTRMFAGGGGPEQTNRRFHYVSRGMPAIRLSTAFDSVTLYGGDPDTRPDIYGKVGNSGVSVATLDDAKKLSGAQVKADIVHGMHFAAAHFENGF